MSKADFVALKQAVEELHGCEANYLSSEHVRESWGEALMWDGSVSVFGLTGHPAATICYAWSLENRETGARLVYAILRVHPIETARDAVLASLALKQSTLRAPAPA